MLLGEPSTVQLRDLGGWVVRWSVPIDAWVVTALRFSPCGRRLLVVHRHIVRSVATVADDFCWTMVGTHDGSTLWSGAFPDDVGPLIPVFNPDGTLVGTGGVRTQLWDADTGAPAPGPGGPPATGHWPVGLCAIAAEPRTRRSVAAISPDGPGRARRRHPDRILDR